MPSTPRKKNPLHDASAADDRNDDCCLGVENGDNAAVGASDSCGIGVLETCGGVRKSAFSATRMREPKILKLNIFFSSGSEEAVLTNDGIQANSCHKINEKRSFSLVPQA
jgi:hypothetical protein